jgi:glycosyltransferase involved in cell wall biosynthesis
MMQVLHVIPSLAKVHGGPSQAIELFEQACVLQGIAMTTISTDDDGPGKRITGTDTHPSMSRGSKRYFFKKNTEFYKMSFSLCLWLWRNMKNYDLVHIHALFSFTSSVAFVIARIKKVPYIIRPLGTLNHYGRQHRRAYLKRVSIAWLEAGAIRRAAAMHFTSKAEQLEAESLAVPMQPLVLPLAVNSIKVSDPLALIKCYPELEAQPYLLFMSRLDPKKNIEALLHAVQKVQSTSNIHFYCVLAGSGLPEYEAALKKLASDLGIANRVIWTGHLQAEVKSAALAGAQFFVLPSYSENFGIAAAEALSVGLPCVLGHGVALAEDAEKAGAAIAVDTDAESIAAAITELLGNAALREKMSGEAKRLANEQYSVVAMGLGLQKLYDGVLQKNSHRAVQ